MADSHDGVTVGRLRALSVTGTMVGMSSLRGRTALITGASSGIGAQIALALAETGTNLILPVRDRGRARSVVDLLRHQHPSVLVELAELDLADPASVRKFAETIRRDQERLDLVVLNAGMVPLGQGGRRLAPGGAELCFQTNFLGHAALVLELLPLLESPSSRIVAQMSLAARHGRWHDSRWGGPEQKERSDHYRPLRAYQSSKLALGLFVLELHRRVTQAQRGPSVQLSDPGVVPGSAIAPELRQKIPAPLVRFAADRLGNTPAEAARTALAAAQSLAVDPALFVPSGVGGWAGVPRQRPLPRNLADQQSGARVWHRTLGHLRAQGQLHSAPPFPSTP